MNDTPDPRIPPAEDQLGQALGDALRTTYPAVVEMMASADAKEGPLAFSEKRAPNWTGR